MAGDIYKQVQRNLLLGLEVLLSKMNSDRRYLLDMVRLEEAAALEEALTKARESMKAERERAEVSLRERIAEEGPGIKALASVGLVGFSYGGGSDRRHEQVLSDEASWRGELFGKGLQFCHEGTDTGALERPIGALSCELEPRVARRIEAEFRERMEKESAQVLLEEDKALARARDSLAAEEEARASREVKDLGTRITDDGRAGLESLSQELQLEAEDCLQRERTVLKQALEGALEKERQRLLNDRELLIADARDRHRRDILTQETCMREESLSAVEERKRYAEECLGGRAQRARESLNDMLKVENTSNHLDLLADVLLKLGLYS
ncbi:unnamed protein product [Discosporangium mesarthrocarpum]